MKGILFLGLILGLILLALYYFGIIDAIINVFYPPEEAVTYSETDQWSQINTNSVEKGCLKRGKQIAKEQGYGDYVIWGCDCTAQESEEIKSYECSLSALDGSHPFEMICHKSESSCLIITESETEDYTFEEIQELLNG